MLYNPPSGSADANAPYVGKDVAAGRQGSRVPPGAAEFPQREIVAIIAAAQAMGLGTPSNSDLAQMLKAVRSGLLNRFPATGSPDAIAIAPSPVYSGLVEGMRFRVKVPGAGSNTSVNPTLGINSLSSPILRGDGTAVAKGDLVAGRVVEFEIDAALNARIGGAFASITNITQALLSNVKQTKFSNATATSISQNNTFYPVLFGDASTTDLTNNGASGFTVQTPGLYALVLQGFINTTVTGSSSNAVNYVILRNGVQVGVGAGPYYASGSGVWASSCLATVIVPLLAGDVIVPMAQTSVGNPPFFNGAQAVSHVLTFTKIF